MTSTNDGWQERMLANLRERHGLRPITPEDVKPGVAVTVQGFGRLRSGKITKVNKARAVVSFARNSAGTLAERPFPFVEIYVPVTEE